MEDDLKNSDFGSSDPGNKLSKSEMIFREFLSKNESGANIETEDFLAMYPDLEDELRLLFDKIKEKSSSDEDNADKKDQSIDLKKRSNVFGDYRIIREIGSGGMATVYEAEQISLKRKVALKILPPHLNFSDKALKRFQREAEAGGRQSHQGIVSIYAIGEHDDKHYIAEQYVGDGNTLSTELSKIKKSSDLSSQYYKETAVMVAAIADALQHAHKSGVIHRDIKPSNILVSEDKKPVVSDFGLAKIEDALALSRTGDFSGTPFYMSPEQAMSSRIGIDHRTDIYSLGVTLYEALTFTLPFEGKTSSEVLKKIILKDPLNPRKRNPSAPTDLSVICLKAMEKDPNHRYQTMQGFLDDLNRFINNEVILAKPPRIGVKLIKKIKRNPVLTAASSAALIILAAFVIYLMWSYPQILKERDKTKIINNVLIKILDSAHPDIGEKDESILDIIDRVKTEIETELSSDPKKLLLARNAIAWVYAGSGFYGEAEDLYRKALNTCINIYGPNHEDSLQARNDLSCVLMFFSDKSKLEEAKSQFVTVLDIWTDDYGSDDPRTLKVMDNLAVVMQKLGDHEGAMEFYNKVIPKWLEIYGPNDPATLTSMNNLGALLMKMKKYEEAESNFNKVFAGRKSTLGEDHTSTLRVMHNLSCCLKKLNKTEQALKYLQVVNGIQNRKLRKNHPESIITKEELVDLHLSHKPKNYKEASNLLKELVDYYKGSEDQSEIHKCLSTTVNLCIALVNSNSKDEAEEIFLEVYNIGKKRLPSNDERMAIFYKKYGEFMLKVVKDYDSAVRLYAESFKVFNELYGVSDERVQTLIEILIELYGQLGNQNEVDYYKKLSA